MNTLPTPDLEKKIYVNGMIEMDSNYINIYLYIYFSRLSVRKYEMEQENVCWCERLKQIVILYI